MTLTAGPQSLAVTAPRGILCTAVILDRVKCAFLDATVFCKVLSQYSDRDFSTLSRLFEIFYIKPHLSSASPSMYIF